MFYKFWRTFFRIFLYVFARWRVVGIENVPSEGPLILVSNHVSNWDPVMIGCAMKRQVCYMAKAELFNVPVLGKVLPWLGVFPIKRGQSDIAALRTALEILNNGSVLGMFPEGTRSQTGEMQKFKSGVAMLVYKAKCPIVPIALINSKDVFKGWFKPVRVLIGKPFLPELPEGKASAEDLQKITDEIESKVLLLRANEKLLS